VALFRTALEQFARLDADGDGRISGDDLLTWLGRRDVIGDAAAAVAALRRAWRSERRHRLGWTRQQLTESHARLGEGPGNDHLWDAAFAEARSFLADPCLNRGLTRRDDPGRWWEDIHQGRQNDCWFVSAVIGLGRHRPEALRRLIRPGQDGTWDVTFPGRTPIRGLHVSDAELACFRRVDCPADGVLLPLLEKAYSLSVDRSTRSPLEDIDAPAVRGGKGLRLLTGHGSRVYPLWRGPFGWWRGVVERRMRDAARAGRLMTASNTNFRTGHVYAVVAHDPAAGTVILRDPYQTELLSPLTLEEFERGWTFLFVESRGDDGGFF
jgi:hypothetical protein